MIARVPLKQHVLVPATRLDSWRLRHLPRWLLALWPVRYREIEVLTAAGLYRHVSLTWSEERLEQLRAMERR